MAPSWAVAQWLLLPALGLEGSWGLALPLSVSDSGPLPLTTGATSVLLPYSLSSASVKLSLTFLSCLSSSVLLH